MIGHARLASVDMVTETEVHFVDQLGGRHSLDINRIVGKGLRPVQGEVWIIDRTLGEWTPTICLTRQLPEITGNVDEDSANDHLLTALEALGVISDEAVRVEPGSGGINWLVWMNVHP